jgi:hypothetical protein
MKSIIFWDMTPCSLLSCNRRFGGTYRLHLQGRRNNFSKKPASKQNNWLTLNGLHGVISQKLILFITTAVRTSNPTQFCFIFWRSEVQFSVRRPVMKTVHVHDFPQPLQANAGTMYVHTFPIHGSELFSHSTLLNPFS